MTRALGRGIVEVPNSAEAYAALDNLNWRLTRLISAPAASKTDDAAENSDLPASQVALDSVSRAHFVRYGAALLEAPTPVSAEPALPTQRGASRQRRDVASARPELDYDDLRLKINGLCQWLQLLKIVPRRIFLLGDVDSIIIGRAVALQLGVDFQVVNGDGYTHSKSLIVSADSRSLTAPPLRTIFPGQVLYSLNLHRETGSLAPDVASLTQPNLVLPWQNQRLTARKTTEIVERIFNAPLRDTNGDWLGRLEFFRARRALLTAGNSTFNRTAMLPETL